MEFDRGRYRALCGTAGLHPGALQQTSLGDPGYSALSRIAKSGAYLGGRERGVGCGRRTIVGAGEEPA